MTTSDLAQLATLALYVGMGALAVAMLAFATHLAGLASRQSTARAPQEVLVGAGGPETVAAAPPDDATDPLNGEVAEFVEGTEAVEGGDGAERTESRRAGRGGDLGMSFTWLAAMVLVASIVLRGIAVSRPPFANLFEFAVAGVAATLLVYLVLALRRPLRWLGLFVVVPSLLVLGIALTAWYVPAAELAPALQSYWLAIHVPIAVLSTGLFTVAFCVLLLQLAKERREARLRDAVAQGEGLVRTIVLDRFPSATRLDRLAYSLHVAAFPLWTFTIIAGAIWGQQAWGTYWSWDPKETWSFVIWVLYAAYLHARATSGWSRRTANIIAVTGYIGIVINLTVVNFWFSGLHSYAGL